MKAVNSFSGLKQSFSTFWSERNRRERNLLLVAMVVVVVGLFYVLLIDPALSGRKDLEKKLPAMRQQSAEIRAMAQEASALSGKAAAPVPPITRESLDASLARNGLKAQSVLVTGELAKIQLSSVSFAGLVGWLEEMQKSARLTVLDANIDALAQADTVNATLSLRQQRSEQSQ
ncbi:type II secretion system protein GspM [Noviherbaspirillum massiliense]|uniref:type II secretion system protein GspM n=1 Tax=Noviherbaspirillum massiliense TaxID=1465823 RepID=UPI0002EFD904|nr:type II secretion system protein GspM [Noviherbaspirillum massiliense]